MRVLITGDSWSQGEWDQIDGCATVTHGGISQFLQDDNHEVVNVGRGGYNNLESLHATHDLLNDMLSTIQFSKRERMMKKINIIIERFIKLREIYSNYNDRLEIESYKIFGNDYRPLKDSLLILQTAI